MAKFIERSSDGITDFTELLDAAEHGETIVFSRRGRPVAHLAPARSQSTADDDEATAAVERILARSIRVGLPSEDMISEGRRPRS